MACPIPLDGRNKNLIFIMLTATHIKNIKVIKVLFITYHRPDISVNLAALRSRCEHYILQLWLLSSFFFFFPRLFSAVGDWMSTILPYMICLDANLECSSEMCCTLLAGNCSVLFLSRPRSEGWPHHRRTFSI